MALTTSTAVSSTPALLDAQTAVILQLQSQLATLEAAATTAHETMIAAIMENERAKDAVQHARDALAAVHQTFARVGAFPAIGYLHVPARQRVFNDDVLAEIFKAWNALPEADNEPDISSSRIAPAFTAASVSKQWRSVALCTPSIWTTVFIDFTFCDGAEEHINLILTRSHNQSLVVELENVPVKNRILFSQIRDDLIAQLLGRARDLIINLQLDFVDFDTSFLPLLQSNMPVLDTLVFKNAHALYMRDVTSGTKLLTLAPNLRVLDLSYVPYALIDAAALPNLESFASGDDFLPQTVVYIATVWRKLVKLEVGNLPAMHMGPSFGTGVFPRLESLVCRGPHTSLGVMSPHTAPALCDLSIMYHSTALRELRNFTQHAGSVSKIQRLTLTAVRATSDLWTSIVDLLSNLSALILEEFTATELAAVFSTWSTESKFMLPPKLSALHLMHCDFNDMSIRLIVDWIAARHAGTRDQNDVLPLDQIRILQEGWLSNEQQVFPQWVIPRLQQLVAHVEVNTSEVKFDS